MSFAGSEIWLADAGLDPGGIIGGLLCLGLVAIVAIVTGRSSRQRRVPGAPIYRRDTYRRNKYRGKLPWRRLRDTDAPDEPDWGSSGGSHDSANSHGSGGGCGGGCGGGGSS
jgi:hypothetical protein